MTGKRVIATAGITDPEPEAPASGDRLAETDTQADQIADEVNRLHGEISGAALTTISKMIRAGELLCEQKAKLRATFGHGQWLAWLTQNVHFTVRTAQRYMVIFTRRDELLELVGKYDTVSYFNVGEALASLDDKYGTAAEELDLDDQDEPSHGVPSLDTPGCDNAEGVEGESGEPDPDEEEAEGPPDSQLSTKQESP
jgi:hypothetical protein